MRAIAVCEDIRSVFRVTAFWLLVIATAGGFLLAVPTAAQSDPSRSNSTAPMALINPTRCGDMLADAVRIEADIRPRLADLESIEPRLLRSRMAEVARICVSAEKIKRIGGFLIELREPAGRDLELRGMELSDRASELIITLKNDPYVEAAVQRYVDTIPPKAKAIQTRIPGWMTQGERGLWEGVERALYDDLDDLQFYVIWSDAATFNKYRLAMKDIRRLTDGAMQARRDRQATEYLTNLRAQLQPDFDKIVSTANQAIASIEQTGQAEIDGATLDGPGVLRWYIGQWAVNQHKLVQCRAVDGLLGTSGDRGKIDLWEDQLKIFSLGEPGDEQLSGAAVVIGRLIEADMRNLPPEQVRSRYLSYLGTLAKLLARMREPQQARAVFEGKLTALAAKSPEFSKEVQQYHSATSDLLRWRGRATNAYINAHLAQALVGGRLDSRGMRRSSLLDAYTTDSFVRRSAPMYFATQDEEKSPPDQTIVCGPVFGLGRAKNMAVSSYESRSYVLAALPPSWADEAVRLREDLLVDESHPPLTLQAAVAIIAADEGTAELAAGPITDITLHPHAVFLGTLPTAAGVMMPLGELSPDRSSTIPTNDLITRISTGPGWAAGEYFFVQAPPPAPADGQIEATTNDAPPHVTLPNAMPATDPAAAANPPVN